MKKKVFVPRKFKHKKSGRIATEVNMKGFKNHYEYLASPSALVNSTIPADMIEDSNEWEEILKEFYTKDGFKVKERSEVFIVKARDGLEYTPTLMKKPHILEKGEIYDGKDGFLCFAYLDNGKDYIKMNSRVITLAEVLKFENSIIKLNNLVEERISSQIK